MASITEINGKLRVLVRLKGYRPTSRYFSKSERAAAEAWGATTEANLQARSRQVKAAELTVAAAVVDYRELRATAGRPLAADSNQHYMLERLAADFAGDPVAALAPKRFVAWAAKRKREGAGPYTIYMELMALGTLLRAVAAYRNLVLPDVVGQARPLLLQLQLIRGSGNRRARRVQPSELDALCQRLPQYADLFRVAATVGLRRGEICAIRWADLDEINRAVLVRGRKHPRRIESKDEWVPLLGEAWDLVQARPRVRGEPRIFPIHPQTLTKAVTSAARALGLPDFRLHDLRHEASSRLRDQGFDEIERMAVLGHSRPEQNAGYTHVTLEQLHLRADAGARGTPPGQPRPRKAARPRRA